MSRGDPVILHIFFSHFFVVLVVADLARQDAEDSRSPLIERLCRKES